MGTPTPDAPRSGSRSSTGQGVRVRRKDGGAAGHTHTPKKMATTAGTGGVWERKGGSGANHVGDVLQSYGNGGPSRDLGTTRNPPPSMDTGWDTPTLSSDRGGRSPWSRRTPHGCPRTVGTVAEPTGNDVSTRRQFPGPSTSQEARPPTTPVPRRHKSKHPNLPGRRMPTSGVVSLHTYKPDTTDSVTCIAVKAYVLSAS